MKKALFISLIGALFLSACSSNGKYVARGASYKTVSYGSVTAKEEVTIGGSNSGIGAYVGSAAAIHDATSNSFLGLIVRGLAGSIVGSATEEVATRKSGMLYTIETSRGNTLEITSTEKQLGIGSCVRIANAGGRQVSIEAANKSYCVTKFNTALTSTL